MCDFVEDPYIDEMKGEGKFPYFGESLEIHLCGNVTNVQAVESILRKIPGNVSDTRIVLHALAVNRRNAKMTLQERYDYIVGRYTMWLNEYLELKKEGLR